MGLCFSGASSCGCSRSSDTETSNPNPGIYRIKRKYSVPGYCALFVNYPGCKNYEGNKVLVYRNDLEKVLEPNNLDPHFCEKHLSPIARIEPTNYGWKMAKKLVDLMAGGKTF